MKRVIILVLDSFGIGSAPDASQFGDAGANTFLHIAQACQLHIPHLAALGLVRAAAESSACEIYEVDDSSAPQGIYGYASEISHGKDTPSGHWEIAGVPVLFDWGYFPELKHSFPPALIKDFIRESQLPGILGDCHASGTVIIDEMGAEHMQTGKPIVYTSADSVLQIAAHEESFGLERLYAICKIARKLVDPYRIGRVIARPFLGNPGHFYRTANRHDYTTPPHAPTLLDLTLAKGGHVIGIGKIPDIFAHRGLSKEISAPNNMALFDATLTAMKSEHEDKTLIFTNFVDFDSSYGHRRDVMGYAHALEQFDARLPELQALLKPDDIVVITADHGCDPTWRGTDHTRENIPILVFGPSIKPKDIGHRHTFSDIGQSIAHYFGFQLANGTSFL